MAGRGFPFCGWCCRPCSEQLLQMKKSMLKGWESTSSLCEAGVLIWGEGVSVQLMPNRWLKSMTFFFFFQGDEYYLDRFTCVLLLLCLWVHGHKGCNYQVWGVAFAWQRWQGQGRTRRHASILAQITLLFPYRNSELKELEVLGHLSLVSGHIILFTEHLKI